MIVHCPKCVKHDGSWFRSLWLRGQRWAPNCVYKKTYGGRSTISVKISWFQVFKLKVLSIDDPMIYLIFKMVLPNEVNQKIWWQQNVLNTCMPYTFAKTWGHLDKKQLRYRRLSILFTQTKNGNTFLTRLKNLYLCEFGVKRWLLVQNIFGIL